MADNPAEQVRLAVADGSTDDAIAFGVAASLVYTIYSSTNSSPQTTELFASDRSETLWKYVRMGGWQSALLVGIMAWRASAGPGGWRHAVWPVLGGGLTGIIMWRMYDHALTAGDGQKPPSFGGKEKYPNGDGGFFIKTK